MLLGSHKWQSTAYTDISQSLCRGWQCSHHTSSEYWMLAYLSSRVRSSVLRLPVWNAKKTANSNKGLLCMCSKSKSSLKTPQRISQTNQEAIWGSEQASMQFLHSCGNMVLWASLGVFKGAVETPVQAFFSMIPSTQESGSSHFWR